MARRRRRQAPTVVERNAQPSPPTVVEPNADPSPPTVVEPNADPSPPTVVEPNAERSPRTTNETTMNVEHCPRNISNTVAPEAVSHAPPETFRGPSTPPTQHLGSTSSGVVAQGVESSSTIDSRVTITPHGNTFLGAPGVARKITAIMQSHYEGSFTCFTEVPIEYRNLWFEEFSKQFRWNDEDSAKVKRIWEKNCSRRLSAMIGRARRKEKEKGQKPNWVRENFWNEMNEYFSSEDFQKISEVAQDNRSKLIGASHTGGCLSFSELEERERKLKGDKFDFLEFFIQTHTCHEGPNKGKFVNEEARILVEQVELIQERYRQSSTPAPPIKDILFEAAKIKKGRVVGLGSEGAALMEKCSLSVSGNSTSAELELQQMRKDMINMRNEMKKRKGREDALVSLVTQLCGKLGVNTPPAMFADLEDDSSNEDDIVNLVDHHPSSSGR